MKNKRGGSMLSNIVSDIRGGIENVAKSADRGIETAAESAVRGIESADKYNEAMLAEAKKQLLQVKR
jgi:hypothetical protein